MARSSIPDLVLRPTTKRRFTRRHNGRSYTAQITVYLDAPNHSFSDYAHPYMSVMWTCNPGSDACGETMSIKYQQHRSGLRSVDLPDNAPIARGFLHTSAKRSHCYAMEVEARCEYEWQQRAIRWTMDLLDAVTELHRKRRHDDGKRYNFRGCDMLPIIVGARLLGIPVAIYNPQISERRDRSRQRHLAATGQECAA